MNGEWIQCVYSFFADALEPVRSMLIHLKLWHDEAPSRLKCAMRPRACLAPSVVWVKGRRNRSR